MRRAQRLLANSTLLFIVLTGAAPERATAEDTIALGAPISQTGKFALNGATAKKGYDLAVRKVNEKGGVTIGGRQYKLAIKYYDDESTPARGSELAERLIEKDGVDFMLGPYSGSLTKAILPIVEKHGVPMVDANGVARDLLSRGYRSIFAVSASGGDLGDAVRIIAESAQKLGKTPDSLAVALAVDEDPFSQDVRAGVFEAAARHGMRVVIDDQLSPELDDMSATLGKVKMLRPDILVVSGHERGAVTAVTQLAAMRVTLPVVMITHCESARLAEKLADASEDIFCASQWHPSLGLPDPWFGSAAGFASLYRATYGEEAPSQAAQSAAAVLVYADAFSRARSLKRAAVREALAATELDTFFGRIDFDETGRNVAKHPILLQVRGGKYVVVGPPHLAKGEPIIPRGAGRDRSR